jgi:hypothetical protein
MDTAARGAPRLSTTDELRKRARKDLLEGEPR